MTLLCISREDKTKWILIIRIRLVFSHADSKFDVNMLEKIAVWNNGCVLAFFCGGHKIICGYNFAAPLIM